MRMSERLATLGQGSALHSPASQKVERKEIAECLMRELEYYKRVIRLVKTVDKTFEVNMLRLFFGKLISKENR